MRLTYSLFSRCLLTLVLKSTEEKGDMAEMAPYYPNPLSKSQPAAHPLTASSLSWELAGSLLFWRIMFDLITESQNVQGWKGPLWTI